MKRQKNKGIYLPRNSRYWKTSFIDPITGEQVRVTTGETMEPKALEFREKLLAERVRLKYLPAEQEKEQQKRLTFTVNDLLDWAQTIIWENHKRPLYLKSTLGPIRKHLGAKIASTLSIKDVLEFRSSRITDGVTISTAIHPLTYLAAAFEAAVNCDELTSNPVKKAKKSFPHLFPVSKARIKFLNVTQRRLLLDSLSGDLRLIVIFALRTGMRQGEILRQEWRDIDLDRMLLRTWSQKGKNKTIKERFIPILPNILDILNSLPRIGRTVFSYDDGMQLSKNGVVHSSYADAIDRLAKLDPIFEDFTFHDLRHTFASEYLAMGGNINRLGKILGHASTIMTERYGHLTKESLIVEMNLLPRLEMSKSITPENMFDETLKQIADIQTIPR